MTSQEQMQEIAKNVSKITDPKMLFEMNKKYRELETLTLNETK